jgi:DNA-binding transcriptional regulator YhcF (GntR family)
VRISVDTSSPVPPFEQIRAALADLIVLGELEPGASLPSVRQLANDLGLAAGTVQRAYTELATAGLAVARSRRGVVVADPADRVTTPPEPDRLVLRAQRFVARCRLEGFDDDDIRRAVLGQLRVGDHADVRIEPA